MKNLPLSSLTSFKTRIEEHGLTKQEERVIEYNPNEEPVPSSTQLCFSSYDSTLASSSSHRVRLITAASATSAASFIESL